MLRLRELREERDLTLEQVAKSLGLKNQYVSNYELGKRKPDYETIKKFADFYSVTVDYLLERENMQEDHEYLRVVKDAKENDISADELQEILDFFKKAKRSN